MIYLSHISELVKSFLQLPALSDGMPTLLMKLTILSRIVRLRYHDHGLWLPQHVVSIHFHEYAPWVCSEVRVLDVKSQPSLSLSSTPIHLGFSFLCGIYVFSTDFSDSDDVHDLPLGLDDGGFLLLS